MWWGSDYAMNRNIILDSDDEDLFKYKKKTYNLMPNISKEHNATSNTEKRNVEKLQKIEVDRPLRLIIISDAESDAEDRNVYSRGPNPSRSRSKKSNKSNYKRTTSCKKSNESNLKKLNSNPRATSCTKQLNALDNKDCEVSKKMLTRSKSQENQYHSVSQLLRADNKLSSCFINLERIDKHIFRATDNSDLRLLPNRNEAIAQLSTENLQKIGEPDEHKTNSETSSKAILAKFYDAHIQPDETIPVYLARLKELSQRLKKSKGAIGDFHLACKMINSLPEQYGPVVSHLYQLTDSEFTVATVEEALLAEEERFQQPVPSPSCSGAASSHGLLKSGSNTATDEAQDDHAQVKMINNWSLSFQNSEKIELTVEGYINGKTFSKIPVSHRLTTRKFMSVNKETFCLDGSIYDPGNCIPLELKTKFKDGLPRTWKFLLTKWIKSGNKVSQESLKSSNKTIPAQTSKDKIDFDSGHELRCSARTRSQSSRLPEKIIKNKNINSKIFDQENATQPCKKRKILANENGKCGVPKTRALKRRNSNVMQKESSKFKKTDKEEKVITQIDEIDINFKCPKSLQDRKKLKKTISELAKARKGSSDIFEDEEGAILLKDSDKLPSVNNESKLWNIDLQSNISGLHDISSSSSVLTTTPAKFAELCNASTPASISPSSSYCRTPKTSYADHYIHRQLKAKKKKKVCVKKIENPTFLHTSLNRSTEEKVDEVYNALIAGKELPKSLFQKRHQLESSDSEYSDASSETFLFIH